MPRVRIVRKKLKDGSATVNIFNSLNNSITFSEATLLLTGCNGDLFSENRKALFTSINGETGPFEVTFEELHIYWGRSDISDIIDILKRRVELVLMEKASREGDVGEISYTVS